MGKKQFAAWVSQILFKDYPSDLGKVKFEMCKVYKIYIYCTYITTNDAQCILTLVKY